MFCYSDLISLFWLIVDLIWFEGPNNGLLWNKFVVVLVLPNKLVLGLILTNKFGEGLFACILEGGLVPCILGGLLFPKIPVEGLSNKLVFGFGGPLSNILLLAGFFSLSTAKLNSCWFYRTDFVGWPDGLIA